MAKHLFTKGARNPKWKGGITSRLKKCAHDGCDKNISYRASVCNKHKPITQEYKTKQSEAHKGRKASKETREKMSRAGKGKIISSETRLKMSLTKKANPIRRLGEKNHQWKGGVTPVRASIRHSFKYRQWRSDVFTRDDYTCQICFKRGGQDINADHYPKMFSEIMVEYNIKSFDEAMKCEELWNINNGRTLCVECHKKHTYQK